MVSIYIVVFLNILHLSILKKIPVILVELSAILQASALIFPSRPSQESQDPTLGAQNLGYPTIKKTSDIQFKTLAIFDLLQINSSTLMDSGFTGKILMY